VTGIQERLVRFLLRKRLANREHAVYHKMEIRAGVRDPKPDLPQSEVSHDDPHA
jgi:hypothetical protein